LLFVLALAGCPNPKDVSADDTAPTDSVPTDDTSVPTDETPTGPTEGPDLPDCTPQTGTGDTVALVGVVLGPDGAYAGSVVYDAGTGLVSCAGPSCDHTGAEVVCTEGIISPGLLDAHNHLQYNSLPPWQVEADFDDRYDWQDDGRYWDYRTAYDVIEDDYVCEIMKWAEIRELVHGTTGAVGSTGGSCIDILVRDLDGDEASHQLDGYEIEYSSGRVEYLDGGDGSYFESELASGDLDAVLHHVAEGRRGSVRDEIDHMFDIGMSGPGQAFVHTSDATTEQLAQMATDGTALIWSPRSNLALYATTTPVEIAEVLGVPWAIGTDWTPSGSMAPTGELACADEWLASKGSPLSDVDLWAKVTSDAARVLGLDGLLGTLAPGMRADIAVYDWSRTPYRAIIESGPDAVRLVVVEGQALYGRRTFIDTLAANPEWCEDLDACGASNAVCVKVAESGEDGQTYAELEATLVAAMADVTMPSGYEYAKELYPVLECGDVRPSCDLREPSEGDADGDGVDDAEDVCVGIYDPNQWDSDRDGTGDSCDDTPVDPSGTVTEPPVSVEAVRDPSHPDHPAEGSRVRVTGVVVTGVRAGQGFFVQDPAATEYGGLYVYDDGDATVEPGDVVDVEGSYLEYYGLTQIEYATTTVLGTAELPAASLVSPCDVATSGSLAEPLEAMLVRVEEVEVTDLNPDDPEDYDEFEVAGCLRVDDYLYADLDQPPEGTRWAEITGVLGYSFSNHKLLPRSDEDFAE